ncbi:MAG: Gfo/Idh/MocA family oxidoreductase [Dehalococcoidia bacterium]|nr:Gfo/Idh/MocA family oxidoreductase [Dehalococcoidia bacterium]
MKSLGVLCIGGMQTHQENHAAGFHADDRSHIVAVADEANIDERRRALNVRLAGHYGVPYVEGIDEALALPDVDIVSMCADVERRERVAIACARAGKTLYLDKPLAASGTQAEAVAKAIAESGVTAQMYSFVNTPWARAAKGCVESGRLGRLLAVHTDILFAKGPGGTAPEGPARKEDRDPSKLQFTFVESKREFFDLGVYPIGLCLWLAKAEPVEVSAVTGNYFFEQHVRNGTEDFGAVTMRFQDGVVATATGGRIGWHSHPAGGPHRITVVGERGTERFDAWEPRLEVYSKTKPAVLPDPHPQDPMGMWRSTQQAAGIPRKATYTPLVDETRWYPDDVSAFLDCLEQGREPVMTAARAVRPSRIISAAYRAAANGRPERV